MEFCVNANVLLQNAFMCLIPFSPSKNGYQTHIDKKNGQWSDQWSYQLLMLWYYSAPLL